MVRLEARNGRSKTLLLTEKGFEVVERQVKPLIDMENAVFDRWAEADREAHRRLTEQLLADLREEFAKIGEGESR